MEELSREWRAKMKADVVYIKIEQCTKVYNRKIYLKDIAAIIAPDNMQRQIENILIYTVKGDKNEKAVFSIMKIIKEIQKNFPQITVENIGETDFIVEYILRKPPNKLFNFIKLFLVCLIVFFGSAFTIMTFNTDVSVGDVFDNFYYLVMGVHKEGGSILEAAYSIGIPVGILGFYNHFSKLKAEDDPTPIHMEMRSYEENLNKSFIIDYARENKTIE